MKFLLLLFLPITLNIINNIVDIDILKYISFIIFILISPIIIYNKKNINIKATDNILDYLIIPIVISLTIKPDLTKQLYFLYLSIFYIISTILIKILYNKSKPMIMDMISVSIFSILNIFIHIKYHPVFIMGFLIFIKIYLRSERKIEYNKICIRAALSFITYFIFFLINKIYSNTDYSYILPILYSVIMSFILFSVRNRFSSYILSLAALGLITILPIKPVNLEPEYTLDIIFISIVTLVLITKRSFLYDKKNSFGRISIVEDKQNERIILFNDNIIHGYQYIHEQENIPTSYYTGPFEDVFKYVQNSSIGKISVIGLGTATIASFGTENQQIDFYEINPLVIEACSKYFTYIENSKSTINIIEGDARDKLAETIEKYDMIIMDGYYGDSINSKLLTYEAFKLYLEKLNENGVIMLNLTSRKFISSKYNVHINRLLTEFKLISYIYHDIDEKEKIEKESMGLVNERYINPAESFFNNIGKKLLRYLDYLKITTKNAKKSEDSIWLIASLSEDFLNNLTNNLKWKSVPKNYDAEIINDRKIM